MRNCRKIKRHQDIQNFPFAEALDELRSYEGRALFKCLCCEAAPFKTVNDWAEHVGQTTDQAHERCLVEAVTP